MAHTPIICCLLTLMVLAEAVPVPRQKPPRAIEMQTLAIPIPRPNPRRQPLAPQDSRGWTAAEVDAARQACLKSLAGLDMTYEIQSPLGANGGCGAPAPISLSRISGVEFEPPAIVTCDLALGLNRWITQSVEPAARRLLKIEVTGVRVAASYVCRSRNNQAGSKLSEHGRANAIDMSGFRFGKSKDVTVGDGWGSILSTVGLSAGGSFLKDIQKDACAHFTTVLGPGSDAYHGNHFHVDTLQRKGGYRICQ